eukprot:TRINITY_DN104583_c0_g1_i1.p1 TRINITY_DN104583_c0_g1~~TRINITY_DN104583_c0_g1_i1.p1  ORF type:complete len:628 (+),score=115.65 TRINITY_DN104583_c0_g1_i1:60-1886(+)
MSVHAAGGGSPAESSSSCIEKDGMRAMFRNELIRLRQEVLEDFRVELRGLKLRSEESGHVAMVRQISGKTIEDLDLADKDRPPNRILAHAFFNQEVLMEVKEELEVVEQAKRPVSPRGQDGAAARDRKEKPDKAVLLRPPHEQVVPDEGRSVELPGAVASESHGLQVPTDDNQRAGSKEAVRRVSWAQRLADDRGKSQGMMDRGMGLTSAGQPRHRKISDWEHKTRMARCKDVVRFVVTHQRFEIFVMGMVLMNSILVGMQTQVMAAERLTEVPAFYRAMDVMYLVVCIVEIALRMLVHGRNFFSMWGWIWNWFDCFLVVVQLTEEVLLLATQSDPTLSSNFSIFSIIRLLRALRVVRLLRVLQHASSLRLLVGCIMYSVRPLFWSSVLIMTMTYIFSIYFTQLVTHTRMTRQLSSEDDSELNQLYGDLFRTALSMFEAITGGLDWDQVVQPLLKNVNLWAGMLLIAYIGFALLAVMNVVTGLFVENAIQRAQEVRQVSLAGHVRDLFKALDVDTSGSISFDELESRMTSDEVHQCFQAIDIHVSEAKALFEMLDEDGSGEIDFSEFLQGCLRLQGPARAVDLLLASREARRTYDKQTSLLKLAANLA